MNTEVVNNNKNKFWSIFVVIFLGAIGSGLWDLFLKDLLFSLVNVMVNVANYFFDGYADSLYSEVGKGQSYGGSLQLLWPIFLTVGIIMFLWRYYFIYFHRIPEKRKSGYFFLFLAILMTVLYSYKFFNSVFTYKAVNYIERSIEIVRPYINQKEFIKLRSEYRSIETKEQFSFIYFKLIKIEEQNEIKLPDFSPLLIEGSKT